MIEALHDGDVFFVAVVLVAGDIAIRAIANLARRVRGPVPDRFAFSIGIPCAFHLVGGGGHAPKEVLGKARGGDLPGRDCAGNLLLRGETRRPQIPCRRVKRSRQPSARL